MKNQILVILSIIALFIGVVIFNKVDPWVGIGYTIVVALVIFNTIKKQVNEKN